MKRPLLYGEGSAIAIISPFIALLLGLLTTYQTLFLALFLFGIWTIAYAFAYGDSSQRFYYLAWGLVAIGVSTLFVTSTNYSVALILVILIVLILFSASQRRGQKKVPAPSA